MTHSNQYNRIVQSGNERERYPNEIGVIYQIPDDYETNESQMLMRPSERGGFYMPIEHTGDCHYVWLKLRERGGNDTTRYFDSVYLFQGYSTSAEYAVTMEPLEGHALVSALVSLNIGGRAAVLIPRDREERSPTQRFIDSMPGLEGLPHEFIERALADAGLVAPEPSGHG